MTPTEFGGAGWRVWSVASAALASGPGANNAVSAAALDRGWRARFGSRFADRARCPFGSAPRLGAAHEVPRPAPELAAEAAPLPMKLPTAAAAVRPRFISRRLKHALGRARRLRNARQDTAARTLRARRRLPSLGSTPRPGATHERVSDAAPHVRDRDPRRNWPRKSGCAVGSGSAVRGRGRGPARRRHCCGNRNRGGRADGAARLWARPSAAQPRLMSRNSRRVFGSAPQHLRLPA